MSADIFNIIECSDIPDTIRKELSINKRPILEEQLLWLLQKAERPLDLDELTVGLYRKYGVIINRRQLTVKAYNFARSKNPKIQQVRRHKGVYKLVNQKLGEGK